MPTPLTEVVTGAEFLPEKVDFSGVDVDVTEGPALIRGIYVNQSLSAHDCTIKDGTTDKFIIPANTPKGSELVFMDAFFQSKIVVAPDAAATGSITVIYKDCP